MVKATHNMWATGKERRHLYSVWSGMTLDAVSASNMRHVATTLDSMFEPVRTALQGDR